MSVTNSWKRAWKKGSFWGAVIVVVAIAAAAIVIFTNPAADPSAGDGRGNAPTSSGPSQEPESQTCDVAVGDTSDRPRVPDDLRWAAAEGWSWPVSDTYGPTQQKNGYGICFARSPVGAALAMANFYGEANTRDAQEATQLYVADSPGKEEAVKAASDLGDGSIGFAGFKVDSFSKNKAEITMVFSVPQTATGYMGLPVTLIWVNGDWKVDVLNDGTGFAGQPVTLSAGDFVEWSGSDG